MSNDGPKKLDCQVKWHIDKWEGGEMWTATAINISNYTDILVKYYFDASVEEVPTPVPTVEGFATATPAPTAAGISRMPHGFIPYSIFATPTPAPAAPTPTLNPLEFGIIDEFRPYGCCKKTGSDINGGLMTSTNYADSCMMEQMLMVLYSTDQTASPNIDFAETVPVDRLANIHKWRIVDTVPWKLLKRESSELNGVRLVDLGMFTDLDASSGLKLWFRFQGNSDDDIVEIEYVTVYGVMK